MTTPGIGAHTAHVVMATLGAGGITQFSGPRGSAAFPGLIPQQHSSGGKTRLGKISKKGNQYVRKPLVVATPALTLNYLTLPGPLAPRK